MAENACAVRDRWPELSSALSRACADFGNDAAFELEVILPPSCVHGASATSRLFALLPVSFKRHHDERSP